MSDEESSPVSGLVALDDRPSSSGTNRAYMAEEFSRSLLGSVEKFHLHAKHRQSSAHVVNVLNLMEIGGASGSSKVDYCILRALIRSKKRKYSPTETFRIRGLATYSCRRLVMPSCHQLVSMDSLSTISILGLDFSERIISTLMVESQPPREDGAVPNTFLLVLSNLGRLRFCNLHTGECLHTFQLPIRRFKFKHIHWNKAFSEVWLLGRAVLPGNDNGSERTGPSPSIAVFEIQPARFKALLQLDKNVFHNIHAAGLEDDVLVTFNSSPHSCTLYSFDEIYRNHCTRVYDPLKEAGQCGDICFNVKLYDRPKQLLDVKGDFSGVYFGGCCKVILCEPQTPREKYVLQEISSNEVPLLHDLRLLGPQQGVALAIDGSTMMLCKDDSSNFLRFEGIHLACYEVASMLTEPKRSEVRVRWRTALLPMRRSVTDGQWVTGPIYRDSVKTKFGRTSRATVTVPVVDNMPVRVLKTTYDGITDLIHLLTLYDIANMDTCTSVGAEPDPDWISLVISIRGVTGEIYKITPVRSIDVDTMRKVDLVADGEIMVLICYDGKNTIAEMYRLTEQDAKKWHPEIPTVESVPDYTPSVLSRKQRRKQRAGRAPEIHDFRIL
ncbi:hypothetical protein V3C99_013143 [Haemonchus contortus]